MSLKPAVTAFVSAIVLAACGAPNAATSPTDTSSPTPAETSASSTATAANGSPSASTSSKPSASPKATASSAAELGLTGVLFFHSYSDYSAWDSNLYGLDLASGELVWVNEHWKTMISPMNAHLNAAGDQMVFMGSAAGMAQTDWDVFVSKWTGKVWGEPTNLTGPNDQRDEDPKFSPDGKRIAYKNNGVLATMNADGSNKQLLTLGAAESSIPFFTPDGRGIIFDREGSVMLRKSDGTESVLWAAGATKAYYAVGVDSERFLFTEVQTTHHDRTMWGFYDGRPAKPLFYAATDCDNSDPYPYQDGSRFVFYVTGCPFIYKGGYNVAVADLMTKKSYDIDDINPLTNTHQQDLGPSWSATAKVKP